MNARDGTERISGREGKKNINKKGNEIRKENNRKQKKKN